jgi:putative sterol carrier protein
MTLDELYSKVTEKAGTITFPPGQPDALILLDIHGDDPRRWLVSFRDSRAAVSEYAGETPDVTASASGDTIVSIAERRLKPFRAFLTGKLKIKGDRDLLRRLSEIWPD